MITKNNGQVKLELPAYYLIIVGYWLPSVSIPSHSMMTFLSINPYPDVKWVHQFLLFFMIHAKIFFPLVSLCNGYKESETDNTALPLHQSSSSMCIDSLSHSWCVHRSGKKQSKAVKSRPLKWGWHDKECCRDQGCCFQNLC